MPESPQSRSVSIRNKQSAQSKRATLDVLRGKRRRTREVEIQVNGEKVAMTFAALSAHDLDLLQGKHTPTVEQRAKGMNFNPDTFAPALVASCLVDPELTEAEAREIWESDSWSTGELSYLFDTASTLCLEGLNVPFTESD